MGRKKCVTSSLSRQHQLCLAKHRYLGIKRKPFWYQLSILWRHGACFFPPSPMNKFIGSVVQGGNHVELGRGSGAWAACGIDFHLIYSSNWVCRGEMWSSPSAVMLRCPVMLWIVFSSWSFSQICCLCGEQINDALGLWVPRREGHLVLLPGISLQTSKPCQFNLMVCSRVQGTAMLSKLI